MMKNLWFISILAFFFTSCNRFICTGQHSEDVTGLSGLFDSVSVRKFQASIIYNKSEISGILILKKTNDSIMAGSFINEFGIKGFDFIISPEGTILSNIFRKLDKWYIRRTLGNDLHFLFLRPELLTKCTIDNKPVYAKKINSSLSYVYYKSENKTGSAEMYKWKKRSATLEQYYYLNHGFILKMRHVKGSMSYEFEELKN
jgi:hypothetical protein